MVTVKVVRRQRYTVVDRKTIRDERLSLRALGLLVLLLDLPEESDLDSTTISQARAEGRDAIRTAFRELEATRYVVRQRGQDARGQWKTITYVGERPFLEDAQLDLAPAPRNPASVDPASVSPALKEKEPGAKAPEEPSPAATAAWAIVNRVYAARNPKPVMGKRQAAHLVERLIVAGHLPEKVEAAMGAVTTISAGSLEAHLAGRRGARQAIDSNRDQPEGRMAL